MIAVTPKGLENVRVTPEQFARFVSDSVRGLGSPAKPADVIKFLDKEPEGKLNLLEEDKPDPTVVSVLQASRRRRCKVKPSGKAASRSICSTPRACSSCAAARCKSRCTSLPRTRPSSISNG